MSISTSIYLIGDDDIAKSHELFSEDYRIRPQYVVSLGDVAEDALSQGDFLEILKKADCSEKVTCFFDRLFWGWTDNATPFRDFFTELPDDAFDAVVSCDSISQYFSCVEPGFLARDVMLRAHSAAVKPHFGHLIDEESFLEFLDAWENVLHRACKTRMHLVKQSDD